MLAYVFTRGARSKKKDLLRQMEELKKQKAEAVVDLFQYSAAMTAILKTSWLVAQRQRQGLPDLPFKAVQAAVSATHKNILKDNEVFKYKFKKYNAKNIVQTATYQNRKKSIEEEDILCGVMK